jgi:hypothetical protein
MKKLLLFICLLISITTFCQDKSLLSNYKFRVPKYKALNLLISSGGGTSNDFVGYAANKQLGSQINSNYLALKSTDKLQQSLYVNLISNVNTNTSNYATGKNKSNTLYASPSLNFNNRWYKKNNFIELGANLVTNLYSRKSKNISSSLTSDTYSDNGFATSLVLGIGNGRLENITDMQNALWLTKSLINEKNLTRSLSNDEINELAKTITQSNNFRVLDARKRIRFVLEKIDSYLQSKNLINKTDINYFTNLNDIVFFANNNSRLAGTVKFIMLIPELENSKKINEQISTITNENITTNFKNQISLKVGFQKYKPLSLNHQIEYGVTAGASYFENKIITKSYFNNSITSQTKLKPIGKSISTDYFVNYNLYPNTRTNIGFSLNGQNGYSVYDNAPSINTAIIFTASANYFINYNTRLFANISESYFQNVYQKSSSLQSNLYNLNLLFNTGLNISF